jgi:RHH-type transcriptional regulator, rel operon repressor / antitoxin RelB
MLSIRLKPALERRLSRLARQTGRTKTFYATKLIEENIEDLEHRYLAEARLEKRGKGYRGQEVRSELGWRIEYDEVPSPTSKDWIARHSGKFSNVWKNASAVPPTLVPSANR